MFFNFALTGVLLSSLMIACVDATDFQVEEGSYDYLGQSRRALTLTYTGKDTFTKLFGYDAFGGIENITCTPKRNVLVLLDDAPHGIRYYANTFNGHDEVTSVFQYTIKRSKNSLSLTTERMPCDFSIQKHMHLYDGTQTRALTLRYTGATVFEGLAGYDPKKSLVNIKCDPTENILLLFEDGPYEITYYPSPDIEKNALFTYQTGDQ